MATYQTLRDRALSQVGCTGQTEAQTVAQIALEEAMKFVSFHVRIPSLISVATATAPASPELEANAITLGGGGFAISSTYQAPDRLYVKKDNTIADIGTPYEYLEYHVFQDLKAAPGTVRIGTGSVLSYDERPNFCWTITPSGKVWCSPIAQNNVISLVYRTVPAAYSGAATPEILPMFDYILVNGAVIALKEWLREPAEVTTLWGLLEAALLNDCKRYNEFLQSQYKRSHLKLHRSYRIE